MLKRILGRNFMASKDLHEFYGDRRLAFAERLPEGNHFTAIFYPPECAFFNQSLNTIKCPPCFILGNQPLIAVWVEMSESQVPEAAIQRRRAAVSFIVGIGSQPQ